MFLGLLIALNPLSPFAQNILAENLRSVGDMPYICENLVWESDGMALNFNHDGPGCGDSLYWEAVSGKLEILPQLIRLIGDTTATAASVPNFGGQYRVGDVAWSAVQEIIHGLPIWELLGVEFDRHNCGYCAYWNHLRADPKNRIAFSKAVKRWYKKHRKNLIWVKSQRFETCDGCRNHPNGGHWELRKENK